MGMGDEYLLHLSYLDGALLDLVLGRLAAIEEPNVPIKPQSQRGMVAC